MNPNHRSVESPVKRLITGLLVASSSLLIFAIQSLVAQEQTRTVPDPSTVRVNRNTPKRGVPTEVPVFSATPTTQEISETRLLPEPLLPVGVPTEADNLALAATLRALPGQTAVQRLSRLAVHMGARPISAWQPSLLVNVGLMLLRDGFQTRAATEFAAAWRMAKDDRTPGGIAVADQAIGSLLMLEARQGHQEALELLLKEIGSRELTGPATEQLSAAKQALAVMVHAPEEVFRCGPFALAQMMAAASRSVNPKLMMTRTGPRGISLQTLADLAAQNGFAVVPAQRDTGNVLPIPSVVHFKSEHFAAIVRREGDRYLVRDATERGTELWYSETALLEELSGAGLVMAGSIPAGWRTMPADRAQTLWGRGNASAPPSPPGPSDPATPACDCGGGASGIGMASYQVHLLHVSLHVFDTPLGHAPAVGPAVRFRLDYNQRESTQPQTFLYSNLGQRWTFDWLSYVKDDPANANATVRIFRRGGGEDVFTGFDASTGDFAPNTRERLQLVRTSSNPVAYELRRPDGSRDVFTQSDASSIYPRRVFMTASLDPQGNAVTFTYDSQLRLVGVTDALGQVTTLAYGLAQDPWKITAVTDPFGRTATLSYDAAGRLERITDVMQLWSHFSYGWDGFMSAITTPYGTSRFTQSDTGSDRRVDMTDPMGGRERVEFHVWEDSSLQHDPASTVPTVAGTTFLNDYLQFRNTLYWNRKAMADAPGDRTKAHIYHWLHARGDSSQAVSILESEKPALENRIWYLYANQVPGYEGDGRQPTVTARVLDDGTTQASRADYNAQGHATKRVDPLGRETKYTYASDGIDVLTVEQKNGAGYELLETRTYNGQHEPLTVTDAAGQSSTYTYTASGQVATVTNAKSETITYGYNTGNQLISATGPVSAASTSFTYDGYGRLRTTTDPDSYTSTIDYDAFDRPTQITYPDGTTEQTQYRLLDVARKKDRSGRWTAFTYDAVRRQTSVRDPLARVIRQEWCTCGSLNALIDANGNKTSWERDAQGRLTKEIRANGSFTTYAYEATTSRLRKVTDPKLQDTNYFYFVDNRLQQMTYTSAVIPTPSVSFTYDSTYGRLATMVDGTGTTTYGYHAVGTPAAPGATRLASVDGPLTNDTITYDYDQLGRVTERAVNGTANTVSWTFDALGRMTSEINLLGTFAYTYQGASNRVDAVTYPNGQTSLYDYFGNTGDRRVQSIHHKYPNGNTLSKFDYAYDVMGNILTWRQQADNDAVLWRYRYDAVDQLTSATKESTTTQAILTRYGYAYDLAGNRTIEQTDDALLGTSYDSMNRILSQQPYGALRLEGTVSEPATLTVGGKPLDVSASNRFSGSIVIGSGTTPFTITAVDPSGNLASRSFEVDSTGNQTPFAFDANGNMTSDGIRTLSWDAVNRLVKVEEGTNSWDFYYDGGGRRSRVVQKVGGVVTADKRTVWCDLQVCEERDSNGVVVRQALSTGQKAQGVSEFHVFDHLRSVRSIWSSSAITQTNWDPWGRGANQLSGRFAGIEEYTDDTWIAPFRAYSPRLGRWLSEDPIGLRAGLNRYRYVDNQPLTKIDPLGLQGISVEGSAAVGVGGMVGIGGGSCSLGGVIDPLRRVACSYWQCCLRLGFGYFVGAGLNLGIALNTSAPRPGWSCSVGAAGEVGAGVADGGGVSISRSSIGGSIGVRPGVGYGGWLGLELCCTKIKSCACW